MNRKQYEKDLQERQKRHLEAVDSHRCVQWQACAHDNCPSCVGTGVKITGESCIHMLYCSCPKCSPGYTISPVSTVTYRHDTGYTTPYYGYTTPDTVTVTNTKDGEVVWS